ncbi:MAG: energy-coupling factor transporter ATPase [Thermodesulfobacteriota bacterium]
MAEASVAHGRSIVEVESLSYRYPKGKAPTLKGITYGIDAPRFVAIMGPTGAGKTTFAMTLNGLVPQFFEGDMWGRVLVMGMDTQKFRIQTLVSRVGLVMQDPETQIFGITVREDVAFGPGNMGLPPAEIEGRIAESLRAVRLAGYEGRFTSELSGGEKQRLAIAGVLAMRPDVLVLDEPTSELDPLGRNEIYAAVDRLRRERHLTILAVEHSSEDIAERADEVVVVNQGEVVWRGRPRDLFCNVPLTMRFGIRPPQVCEFGWRLYELGLISQHDVPLTVSEAADLVRRILKGRAIPRGVSRTLREAAPDDFPPVTPPPCQATPHGTSGSDASSQMQGGPGRPGTTTCAPVAIRVEGLEHSYGPTTQALRGIDLEIRRGEFVALVGQNGAGKTTLVKHFNNLLKPTRGHVEIDGIDTRSETIGSLSRRVGYVFQNPDHQIFCSTVEEEVGYGLRNLGLPPEAARERVREVLRFVGLEAVANRHPFTLGKGERQRVAVASVLVMKPNILVIDEPTTGQDWAGAEQMMRLVRDLHRAGHTIIMITHDMRIVAEYAERVIVMHKGKVVADGTPAEVFSQREVLRSAYLAPPQISLLADELADTGMPPGVTTVDEAVALVTALGEDATPDGATRRNTAERRKAGPC